MARKKTIREWLDEAGFDWESGRIVWQESEPGRAPGWARAVGAEEVDETHPMLDVEFSTGYGAPQAPRFVADDGERIYFPQQYDGATRWTVVHKDIEVYLDYEDYETPYPGG